MDITEATFTYFRPFSYSMERDQPGNNTAADPATSLPESGTPTDLPIALSDLFQLLANDRTRRLLYLLTDRGGTVFFEELETHFDDAAVGLRHHQLPRLVDFHIVDYDREADAVTLTPIGDDLRPALETVRTLDGPEVAEPPGRTER